MTHPSGYLEAASKVVQEVLVESRSMLETAGISIAQPHIAHSTNEDGTSNSEMVLYLQRDGDIVDVIEWDVIRAGAPSVSMTELQSWLFHQIQEAVSRSRE